MRRDPSALPPVKQVLIPLGRSLQRNAGAPDFFRYPRVVAAVDAEAADSSGMPLKDRLFLGYHEKAAIIEVISYNEAAGRFEFQVVKDWSTGSKASRLLCQPRDLHFMPSEWRADFFPPVVGRDQCQF